MKRYTNPRSSVNTTVTAPIALARSSFGIDDILLIANERANTAIAVVERALILEFSLTASVRPVIPSFRSLKNPLIPPNGSFLAPLSFSMNPLMVSIIPLTGEKNVTRLPEAKPAIISLNDRFLTASLMSVKRFVATSTILLVTGEMNSKNLENSSLILSNMLAKEIPPENLVKNPKKFSSAFLIDSIIPGIGEVPLLMLSVIL